MPTSDLTAHIVQRIVEAVQPTRIYLFGSRADGSARPDSDVDLLVVYDGPKPKREVDLAIRQRFWPRLFALDIFVLSSAELERSRTLANSLAREVTERGQIIYG